MFIWRMPSNILVRSHDHIPDAREPTFPYEEDTCFNCGGEFLIEFGGAEFGFGREKCTICGGNGEVLVAYPTYNYYDWIQSGSDLPPCFFFPDGQINWRPQ